jgi:NAD(P)-dependent dehydrogenase (short-subunit alcohol dehydrogenase family)
MTSSLSGRIILVTGASRGIGRAATNELLQRGATVIGTARSMDAFSGEPHGRFIPFVAEMADKDGLQALAEMIASRFGRLDGLFGNAGILGTKTPLGALDDDDFLRTMAINVTSGYRLLHLCDPLLRCSDAGRVLYVTSGVAWKRHAGWTLYAVSKSSLEAMIGVYAHEIEATPIRANLISPGPIRTDMRVEAWPEEDPAGVPLPEAIAPVIADFLSPDCKENGIIYDVQLQRITRNRRPD